MKSLASTLTSFARELNPTGVGEYIYVYIYTCVSVYIYIYIYDGNYTRMLSAILNKSWQQHPTRHQLYGHLPPITKTIQVRRTRHAGHCWRSRDELIRDVLLWIPTHGRAKAGRPARTYIQQLCEDTGCCPEDLPRAMNDREEWRERVRDIRATSAIWWWWWWFMRLNAWHCWGSRNELISGPLHMDEQRQDDQLEPTYISSVPMRNVAMETNRKQCTIERGSERLSRISVLIERHDDDDDDFILTPLT